MELTKEQLDAIIASAVSSALSQVTTKVVAEEKSSKTTKEEPKAKAWEDRTLAEKYETENKRAESFLHQNKSQMGDGKWFKPAKAENGVSFLCRIVDEWTDKKGQQQHYDRIAVKLVDFHPNHKQIENAFAELGFSKRWRGLGRAYVYYAPYDKETMAKAIKIINSLQQKDETPKVETPKVEETTDVEDAEVVEETDDLAEEEEVEVVEEVKPQPKAKAKKEPTPTKEVANHVADLAKKILF